MTDDPHVIKRGVMALYRLRRLQHAHRRTEFEDWLLLGRALKAAERLSNAVALDQQHFLRNWYRLHRIDLRDENIKALLLIMDQIRDVLRWWMQFDFVDRQYLNTPKKVWSQFERRDEHRVRRYPIHQLHHQKHRNKF